MVKHLFKLIWNKRKYNFLFLSEILVSFLVIFAVFSFLVYYYMNYRKPMGLAYDRVWSINYNSNQQSKNMDSLVIFYEDLKKSLKSMPMVEAVSYASNNFPYSNSIMSTGLSPAGKKVNNVNNYMVGDDYNKVWKMTLIEGRWFNSEDKVARNRPIIINESLRKEIFGKGPAIGKSVGDYEDKGKLKIIGVVQDFKANGDFWPAGYAMFNPLDSGYFKYTNTLLVKVRPEANASFESSLYKFMANRLKNSSIEIQHLSEMRDAKNQETIIPMLIFMIIASFLIINVALGLFGVLWYNINQRRGEIGLRRALGASGNSVSGQLISESLILATMSLIVGCFFALQFPIMNVFNVPSVVYAMAILLSIAFIYVLVFVCALYPGKQAAAIHPAVALHEE
nr:ABC transporter permease [Pedobacter sp. ASV19]